MINCEGNKMAHIKIATKDDKDQAMVKILQE